MGKHLDDFAILADAWFWETDAHGRFRVFAGKLPEWVAARATPEIGASFDEFLRMAGADAEALGVLAMRGAADLPVKFFEADGAERSLRLAMRVAGDGHCGLLQAIADSWADAAAAAAASRLAAIGQMVAGVAHEINTPVGNALTIATALADRTERFLETLESGKILKSTLVGYSTAALDASRLILANLERTAELVRGFKQVAVDQASAERRQFDLAGYLDEILASISPDIRKSGQTVEVDCPPGITIDGWPGLLSQVTINLVLNCFMHAFDTGGAGTVSIACRVAPDKAGARVRMEIRDDGKGIAPDVVGRIFDPFFTTKRGDGGSGLGLHIVHNLVTGPLAGTIAVESQLGRGTRFAVIFPQIAPVGPGQQVANG
jgi:signal transduction histidine kinase